MTPGRRNGLEATLSQSRIKSKVFDSRRKTNSGNKSFELRRATAYGCGTNMQLGLASCV